MKWNLPSVPLRRKENSREFWLPLALTRQSLSLDKTFFNFNQTAKSQKQRNFPGTFFMNKRLSRGAETLEPKRARENFPYPFPSRSNAHFVFVVVRSNLKAFAADIKLAGWSSISREGKDSRNKGWALQVVSIYFQCREWIIKDLNCAPKQFWRIYFLEVKV